MFEGDEDEEVLNYILCCVVVWLRVLKMSGVCSRVGLRACVASATAFVVVVFIIVVVVVKFMFIVKKGCGGMFFCCGVDLMVIDDDV